MGGNNQSKLIFHFENISPLHAALEFISKPRFRIHGHDTVQQIEIDTKAMANYSGPIDGSIAVRVQNSRRSYQNTDSLKLKTTASSCFMGGNNQSKCMITTKPPSLTETVQECLTRASYSGHGHHRALLHKTVFTPDPTATDGSITIRACYSKRALKNSRC